MPQLKGQQHPRWDKKPNYRTIHRWIQRTFGDADKCENSTCNGKSKNYDWALIHGKKYERNRKHFWKLCRSCHVTYDLTEQALLHKSIAQKLRRQREK